jgi:homocysteine S-methyltransferase
MSRYRQLLPQLQGEFFLTDGGIETTLIFLEGYDLPYFAAFHLLGTVDGTNALRKYFKSYAELGQQFLCGLVLETPTWRASPDWAKKLGYSADAFVNANKMSVRLLEDIRDCYETTQSPIIISGCVGPRGDGYVLDSKMTIKQAEHYHSVQVGTFADCAVDLISALTINYVEEAVGIVQTARDYGMPVVISFTVETDGKLPSGQELRDAIQQVDDITGGYPAYFMINCAHPTHISKVLGGDAPWINRIRGLRANASKMSHAQLNDAPELDYGNPEELAWEYANLKRHFLKALNVFGGCCGTDLRHVEKIAMACLPFFRKTI